MTVSRSKTSVKMFWRSRKNSAFPRVFSPAAQSITQFAENDAWDQLNEELEATQNEVKKALEENRDTDLITLVSIGGWIRGTEVVTGLVLQNYNAEDAKLLRQPALVSFLKEQTKSIYPAKFKRIRSSKMSAEISMVFKRWSLFRPTTCQQRERSRI